MPAYHFFDLHQSKVVAATQKAFPNLSVHLIEWNDAFDRLIVQTEGVGDPRPGGWSTSRPAPPTRWALPIRSRPRTWVR
ncbi:MAG: hypothetical protein WDN31_02225 [Hyphomicrobium sp.]